MASFLNIYRKFLKSYPIFSQAVQTGILMGAGDVTAQTIVEKKRLKEINLLRTTQFATVGFVFVGPTLTVWYRFLHNRFGNVGKTVVFKKVALDQLGFIPPFLLVLVTSLGLVQMHPVEQVVAKVKGHYPDILITSYKIWPWVQLGNFYFVPLQYQVLIVQIVALFWNTYLSWKTQQEVVDVQKLESPEEHEH